jgi:hypothetical protein
MTAGATSSPAKSCMSFATESCPGFSFSWTQETIFKEGGEFGDAGYNQQEKARIYFRNETELSILSHDVTGRTPRFCLRIFANAGNYNSLSGF